VPDVFFAAVGTALTFLVAGGELLVRAALPRRRPACASAPW
jgi:hypothetical protein